jgi:proteasome accessory factor B
MSGGDRMQRLGSLFAYLLAVDVPKTRDQIVDELPFYAEERGRKRFEDDKASLVRMGISLETAQVPAGTGYIVRRSAYRMPELQLTEPEMAALDLAVRAVGFQGVSWAQLASAKLDLPGLRPTMLAELPGIETLPVIDDAVLTRTRLCFCYHDLDRTLDPWGVAFKHGRWYLVGFDHLRDESRCYRLDRIGGGVESVGGPAAFERPPGFDPADAVPDDPLTMGEAEPRLARVRVDRRIARLLPGREVPADAGVAGSASGDDAAEDVVIEMQVAFDAAFVVWALGWAELAEVLSPPDLRRAVVDRLRELAA